MITPQQAMEDLHTARKSLTSASEALYVEGRKYAELKHEYKKKIAILTATYAADNSAAKAKIMAEGETADLESDYEYQKIMFETTKQVLSARATVCTVLQTEFNGLMKEWNVT